MGRTIVSEESFRWLICNKLWPVKGIAKSVTGPGRSGAIASVYASYFLGVPWLPYSRNLIVPRKLQPIVIIDAAKWKGGTLRKALRKITARRKMCVFLKAEPPLVHFFYEKQTPSRLAAFLRMVKKDNRELDD